MEIVRKIRDTLFPRQAMMRQQNKLLRQEVKRIRLSQEKLEARLVKLMEHQRAQAERQNETAKHAANSARTLSEMRKLVSSSQSALETLQERHKAQSHRFGWELKGIKYWAKTFEHQVQALLRRAYIDPEDLPYPQKLTAHRFRLTSQNQEDGITWALIQEAGPGTRRFVEIGSGMNGGNSGFLAAELGWTGLMVDTDAYKVERLVRQFGHEVKGAAEWVTRENINEIVRGHGMTGEVDLFSIDIDGPDYWIWEALEACSPRIVAIEYNSFFGPDRAVVVPYEADFDRHDLEEHGEWGRYYFGASLTALVSLAERKGYRLVATEPEGANAFFLRRELAPDIPAADPRQAFHLVHSYNVHMQQTEETIYDFIERAGLPLVDLDTQ